MHQVNLCRLFVSHGIILTPTVSCFVVSVLLFVLQYSRYLLMLLHWKGCRAVEDAGFGYTTDCCIESVSLWAVLRGEYCLCLR